MSNVAKAKDGDGGDGGGREERMLLDALRPTWRACRNICDGGTANWVAEGTYASFDVTSCTTNGTAAGEREHERAQQHRSSRGFWGQRCECVCNMTRPVCFVSLCCSLFAGDAEIRRELAALQQEASACSMCPFMLSERWRGCSYVMVLRSCGRISRCPWLPWPLLRSASHVRVFASVARYSVCRGGCARAK